MDGYHLINNTKLGKELEKLIPSHTTRIIIDIQPNEIIKIFYETSDEGLSDLDWVEIINDFKLIKAGKKSD